MTHILEKELMNAFEVLTLNHAEDQNCPMNSWTKLLREYWRRPDKNFARLH